MGTGGAVKFAESTARRALPHAQRRRAHRPRPLRADRRSTSATGARGDARADRASRTRRPTDWCAATTGGAVTEFVEKPARTRSTPNLINAGAYVLERDVLDLIPPDEQRLDRARGLPAAGRRRPLRASRRGLLARHRDARPLPAGHLRHPRGQRAHRRRASASPTGSSRSGGASRCRAGSSRRPSSSDGCRIAAGRAVGSLAVLGRRREVGANATIERAVVLEGAVIGADCTLRDCIVAAGARVGEGDAHRRRVRSSARA